MVDLTQPSIGLCVAQALLRTAPEHLRTVPRDKKSKAPDDDPFYRAQQALQDIRSRGATQYTDLTKTNKRQRREVSSDEEDKEFDQEEQPEGDLDTGANAGLADYWQVSDDQKTWEIPQHRPEGALCAHAHSLRKCLQIDFDMKE